MTSTASPLRVGMNLTEALDTAVGARSPGVALVCGEERLSLDEVRAGAEELAHTLAGRGVAAGDRVGVLAPNGAAFVRAIFGICRLGAVAVLLDVRSTPDELGAMVSTACVGVVVSDRLLEVVAAELVGRDGTVVVGEATSGASGVDAHLRGSAPFPHDARPRSGDMAVVFCTSGTTGRPKLVPHTHRTVMAATIALHRLHAGFFDGTAGERARRVATVLRRHGLRALRARGQQVWMTPIAFSSVSGHQVMLGALLGGHRLVTMPSFHPRVALELVERERVNILAATPSMAELLLSVRTVDSFDPSSLLAVGLGGGPVSPELAERVRHRFRCGVGIGYGSTELGGGVLVSRLADPLEVQTRTVGRPFPGAEVEIVADDGRTVGPGGVGELRCKVPSAMPGYLAGAPQDERHDGHEHDGHEHDGAWYRTGDLATMDGHGNVTIVGRRTDMIVRGSQNVYPVDVERVLDSLPAVERSAVVGVPGGPSGEQVWAFVAVGEGSSCTTREVFVHCRQHLAGYKVPDHVCIRATLPLTHDGKVQKFLLLEEAVDRQAAPSTARDRVSRSTS